MTMLFIIEDSDDSADADYIPDSNSSKSDTSPHSQLFETSKITQFDRNNDSLMQVKLTRRNDTSLDITNTSFVDIQVIPNSRNKSKKIFCIFCKKLVTK